LCGRHVRRRMLKERKTGAGANDTKGARADHPDGEGWDALGQRAGPGGEREPSSSESGLTGAAGGVKAKRAVARGRQVVE
jgi:hypothetical protein